MKRAWPTELAGVWMALGLLAGCAEAPRSSPGSSASKDAEHLRRYGGGLGSSRPASLLPGDDAYWMELANNLRARDPLAEAGRDFADGDLGVYSAMGVGEYWPGLEIGQERLFDAERGKRVEGSSDVIEGGQKGAAVGAGLSFAKRYNQEKYRLLILSRRAGGGG